MRMYPHELTIRAPVVTLLEMYNTGMFRNGRRNHVYDKKFIHLLIIEFVGLDDIESQKPLDEITKKMMFGNFLNSLN